MRWRTRAALSLKAHTGRNIILVILFSALFSVLLIVFACWTSSSNEISFLQQNLGNSVMISRPSVADPNYDSSFFEKEVEQMKENPHVSAYNAYLWFEMRLADATPYIQDPAEYARRKKKVDDALAAVGTFGWNQNCMAFSITDTERSNLFAGGGFTLLSGRPIQPSDQGKEIALVSDTLAALNGWKIGDTVSLRFSDYDLSIGRPDDTLAFTIQGLFSYRDTRINPLSPNNFPANFVFIPNGILEEKYRLTPFYLYAYLDSADNIDTFISEMKQTWGTESMDPNALLCGYGYKWDNGWAESVSFPLNQLNSLSKIITLVVLAGLLLIIALVTALIIRGKRYEYAIYLSMGESKAAIVLQTVCEMMVIFFVSALIGLAVSAVARGPVSQQIMEPYVKLNDTVLQQQKDEDQFDKEILPVIDLMIREDTAYLKGTKTNLPMAINWNEILAVAFFLLILLPAVIAIQCLFSVKVPSMEPKRFR